MASRQPLGYCCTAESAKPWTAITSTPMYGRPRYGRPRLPQAGSSRPEPTACTPCGISTSRYCWMRARAQGALGVSRAQRPRPHAADLHPPAADQRTAPVRGGRRPAHGPGAGLTRISAGQPPGTPRCRRSVRGAPATCGNAGNGPLTRQEAYASSFIVARQLSALCGPDVALPWPRGPPTCSCPCIQRGRTRLQRAGPMGHKELPLMPKDDVTVAGTGCWSMSPRRPAKSAA
jgi:hypothetical protein